MSQRKILKFLFLLLGILAANLTTSLIDAYFLSHKNITKPFIFTWIGMLVIVAIYYPLFKYIDKWSMRLSDMLLRKGKVLIGRTFGVYIIFLVVLLVFYYLYGKLWFHINVITSFFHSWVCNII